MIYQLAFSRDATTLGWYSFADDIVPDDTNGDLDIFEISTWIQPGADILPLAPHGRG